MNQLFFLKICHAIAVLCRKRGLSNPPLSTLCRKFYHLVSRSIFNSGLFTHGGEKITNVLMGYCRTLANGPGAVKNSSKLPRSTDRKNSLSSPAMPLTTSLGERSRVTFRDDVKLSSNQRVGLMTSAVRAWQQQDLCRTKNSQVMSQL
jgi:hypothetical protein